MNEMTIKGAALSSSMLSGMVIFQDQGYWLLALVGAVVSGFGVLYEIAEHRDKYTWFRGVMLVIKGIFVGLVAIPLAYLILSHTGETLIAKFFSVEVVEMSDSIWLILSFGMSWYALPIFQWTAQFVSRRSQDVD